MASIDLDHLLPASAAAPGQGAPAGQASSSASGAESSVYRGVDRRKRPTPRFSRYSLFGGRRQTVRREEEREGSYVDRYATTLALAVLWISVMNLGDSFFTLTHLQSGGIELNPVAAALLESGRSGFVIWKTGLIALALVVLTLHKNFVLARMGLWLAAGGYTLLNLYHLTLF